MQRHNSIVILRDMFLLLCTSSVVVHARGSTNTIDEVLHTENHCQPILVNGELMPTVPEYMPSFPVSLKGIKRHFVCKLSAPTTVSSTPSTTSSPTTAASTTSLEATTNSKADSTLPNPTTTTKPTTTQDTTTISTTGSTTSHTTTTPFTNSLKATTSSISDSTTPNPATTTTSTTSLEATTNFKSDSTTPNPTTSTKSTTTQAITTISTTGSTTSHTTTTPFTTSREASDSTTPNPTTTTKSTAKMFVTGADRIFVADLQDDLNFISIPSSERPNFITHDSVEKKIYWSDLSTRQVYRADEDGGNREEVISGNDNGPRGIAIAESSRILYIAYSGGSKKITTVDIGQGSAFPGNEANFVTGLTVGPLSLEMDEEQGFLYWSMGGEILRKPLNGSGSTETVYLNADLDIIKGLSIDLSRDPRRIFVCDFGKERSFYKDVNQPLTDLNAAHELTDYMDDPDIDGNKERRKLGDMCYFNGTLYWTKQGSPEGIAVMTNYDQSSPSFDIKEISAIIGPRKLLIINADP